MIHLSQFGSNEKIKDDPKREEVTSSDSDASTTSSNGSPKKREQIYQTFNNKLLEKSKKLKIQTIY